jgi:type I restriction enzyme S subunit
MIVGELVDAGHAELRTGPFGTQLRASDYVDDGRPVLNVRNVGLGDVRTDKLEYVDEVTAQRLSGHILQANDIVFGRKGAVERHAFIKAEFIGALQGSDCIRLRILAGAPVRPEFVTFALRTREHQEWMQSFCSHGATMASLNQEILRQVAIPDLDLASQDRVIDVLGAFDDLIDNNRRRIELLEQMAQAIYQEWFVRFRYPGSEDVILADSPVGLIPQGWTVKTIGEITESLTRGISPQYADDGVWTVINQRCIRDSRVSLDMARRQSRDVPPAKQVRFGDVLINSTGVGTLGRTAIYLEHHSSLTADSHITLVRPRTADDQPWFGLHLLYRQPELETLGVGSTGQTELGRQAIAQLLVTRPPQMVRRRFADLAWPLMLLLRQLLNQNERLAAIRDLVLPRLVCGQLDVLDLELDSVTVSVA